MSLHDVPTAPAPERRGIRRGVFLLPSLFTMANLFCGWACVVYAMRGEFHTAAPFIGIAVVLDMLDGRIARMTGSSSAFGVEFDSLADLISFGMAPAALKRYCDVHGIPAVIIYGSSLRMPDGTVRVLVEGKERAKLLKLEDDGKAVMASVKPVADAVALWQKRHDHKPDGTLSMSQAKEFFAANERVRLHKP